MLANFFSRQHWQTASRVLLLCAWVGLSVFVLPSIILVGLLIGLRAVGVDLGFVATAAGTLTIYGVQFVVGFGLMMLLPVWYQKLPIDKLKKLLAITRIIKPKDIGYGLLAFGAYLVLTIVVQLLATQFLPWYNVDETQELGFSIDGSGFDLVLAFIGLVILAPVFEELIFRGYLFSEVRSRLKFWPTAIVVSALFGLAHGQLNVGLDVFVLSMCMSFVREKTGSVWGPILMHMIKNGLAFTLLFIVKIG